MTAMRGPCGGPAQLLARKRYLCDFYHKTWFEPPAGRPRQIGIAAEMALLATSRAKPNGEITMKTILTAAIAALAIGAGVAGSTTSAQAGGYGYGGHYGYKSYGYYHGPKCRYINKYDYYGYYVRTIKVCDYY
jgi:hypothetical protein